MIDWLKKPLACCTNTVKKWHTEQSGTSFSVIIIHKNIQLHTSYPQIKHLIMLLIVTMRILIANSGEKSQTGSDIKGVKNA